jgi:hypothetical protein
MSTTEAVAFRDGVHAARPAASNPQLKLASPRR